MSSSYQRASWEHELKLARQVCERIREKWIAEGKSFTQEELETAAGVQYNYDRVSTLKKLGRAFGFWDYRNGFGLF